MHFSCNILSECTERIFFKLKNFALSSIIHLIRIITVFSWIYFVWTLKLCNHVFCFFILWIHHRKKYFSQVSNGIRQCLRKNPFLAKCFSIYLVFLFVNNKITIATILSFINFNTILFLQLGHSKTFFGFQIFVWCFVLDKIWLLNHLFHF